MKTLISKNGMYEAERIGKNEVQVTTIKGRSIYTSYVITTTVGAAGPCQCSYGKRAGTTCPHMSLVKEFVSAEQEVKQPAAKPVTTFEKWLQEADADGDMLFVSH